MSANRKGIISAVLYDGADEVAAYYCGELGVEVEVIIRLNLVVHIVYYFGEDRVIETEQKGLTTTDGEFDEELIIFGFRDRESGESH